MKNSIVFLITTLLCSSCLFALPSSKRSKLIFKKTVAYYKAIAKRNRAKCGVLLLDDTIVAGAHHAEHAQLFNSIDEFRKFLYMEYQARCHRPWIMSAENLEKVKYAERYSHPVSDAFKFGKQID